MNRKSPVDLTTVGAGVSLPPPDHEIFRQPGANADEFPDLQKSPEAMQLEIEVLKIRLAKLEAYVFGE